MELRMAFGPGTRLWDRRSREDLCYDWLHYKSREPNPSFRQFALRLYLREVSTSPGRADLPAIRRRIATVLRSLGIGRPTAPQGGIEEPVPSPSTESAAPFPTEAPVRPLSAAGHGIALTLTDWHVEGVVPLSSGSWELPSPVRREAPVPPAADPLGLRPGAGDGEPA